MNRKEYHFVIRELADLFAIFKEDLFEGYPFKEYKEMDKDEFSRKVYFEVKMGLDELGAGV